MGVELAINFAAESLMGAKTQNPTMNRIPIMGRSAIMV